MLTQGQELINANVVQVRLPEQQETEQTNIFFKCSRS